MNNSRLKIRIGAAFTLVLTVFVLLTSVFSTVSYADNQNEDVKTTAQTADGAKDSAKEENKSDESVKTEEKSDEKDTKGTETGTEAENKEEKFTNNYTSKGIWQTLSIPFGYVVWAAYQVISDYGIVLLFFAIIMKAILFPFGIKQQKNSVKQARLRPKEMAIRNKYKGRTDKPTQQKMQQEIMELYQKENFNPMGGCLPLLLQFPILLALYQVVYNPLRHIMHLSVTKIELLAQKVVDLGISSVARGDIDIVSAYFNCKDPAKVADFKEYASSLNINADSFPRIKMFGIDLSGTPGFSGEGLLLIWIPIVTFITVFLSMRLTKKLTYQPMQNSDAGKSGLIMDLVMPLMSTWFTFLFPGILGVYWIFQNLLGVVQQFILKKMYPIPVFTDEDYAKAAKEMAGKEIKKKKAAPGQYKRHPNSLHHIDDDDDDVPTEKVTRQGEGSEEKQSARPTNTSGIVDHAELKEDISHTDKKNKEESDKDNK